MRPVVAALLVAPLLASAAAGQTARGLFLQAQPDSPLLPVPPARPGAPPDPRVFQPAPTPNRDLYAPLGPRASNAPELAPEVYSRKDSYRGDGLTQGSSSENSVDRRAKPAPGFSLHLPLQQQ
jgi:hypothetical protein